MQYEENEIRAKNNNKKKNNNKHPSTAIKKVGRQSYRNVDSQSEARYCQMRKMSSIMSISRFQAKMERWDTEEQREREGEK